MKDTTFAEYMPHIRQRWLDEQASWQHRRARAWESARRAAEVLRAQYSATKILAFGSLVQSGRFDDRSDIDLAVEGVPAAKFFRAWADAERVSKFEMDLVDLSDCPEGLEKEIFRAGVSL